MRVIDNKRLRTDGQSDLQYESWVVIETCHTALEHLKLDQLLGLDIIFSFNFSVSMGLTTP